MNIKVSIEKQNSKQRISRRYINHVFITFKLLESPSLWSDASLYHRVMLLRVRKSLVPRWVPFSRRGLGARKLSRHWLFDWLDSWSKIFTYSRLVSFQKISTGRSLTKTDRFKYTPRFVTKWSKNLAECFLIEESRWGVGELPYKKDRASVVPAEPKKCDRRYCVVLELVPLRSENKFQATTTKQDLGAVLGILFKMTMMSTTALFIWESSQGEGLCWITIRITLKVQNPNGKETTPPDAMTLQRIIENVAL